MDLIKSYEAFWVVYNHHIAYIKSANLGEWLRIVTRLVWYDKNTIVVEYLMLDDYKSHLKTLMWTTFKYVGMDNSRITEHPDQVSTYLNAMLGYIQLALTNSSSADKRLLDPLAM